MHGIESVHCCNQAINICRLSAISLQQGRLQYVHRIRSYSHEPDPTRTFRSPRRADFCAAPGCGRGGDFRQGRTLPTPRAIIVVSAHWDTAVPTVGFADRLETIHDFSGFPDELYSLRYPASGCREAAELVVAAIRAAGLPVAWDNERGLDHGAWVPLRLMFPEADVPVIPLSVQSHAGPEQAYLLGQGLAPLAAKGFLVIASGNLTHNLRDYQLAARNGGRVAGLCAPVHRLAGRIACKLGDISALLDYRRQAPGAVAGPPER
jgi:4,5-DOPA dioxygenase extradiol